MLVHQHTWLMLSLWYKTSGTSNPHWINTLPRGWGQGLLGTGPAPRAPVHHTNHPWIKESIECEWQPGHSAIQIATQALPAFPFNYELHFRVAFLIEMAYRGKGWKKWVVTWRNKAPFVFCFQCYENLAEKIFEVYDFSSFHLFCLKCSSVKGNLADS